MTLMELTGHEAGIIVYDRDAKTVAVANWGQCGDDQVPIGDPFGRIISWSEHKGYIEAADAPDKSWRFADVRDEIPGTVWLTDETEADGTRIADTDLDIVFDDFGDLTRIFCDETLTADDLAGRAYALPDGRVILALDMWI